MADTGAARHPLHASMTDDVLGDVYAERARQDAKWGEQNHLPMEWITILGEEFGEVCRAAFEAYWNGQRPEHYREELIQVAAVAVAMVEAYDRNGFTSSNV